MRIACTLAVSLLGILPAQSLEVGIEAGLRATDAVSVSSGLLAYGPPDPDESKRYTLGPTLELRLPWRLSVEFDALYRRFGYTVTYHYLLSTETIRERANSWEFPLISQFRLRDRRPGVRAGAGYAPRMVHGADTDSGDFAYLNGVIAGSIHSQEPTDYALTHGLVLSGGLDFGTGRLRISPELRYVRWRSPFLDQYGGNGSYHLQSSQNDFFFLLGIGWRVAR